MKAWNLLISHRTRYAASFARIADVTQDKLLRYRAQEMGRLLDEVRSLEAFDYELSLKMLDHIEVTAEGKLRVVILTGTIITVLILVCLHC